MATGGDVVMETDAVPDDGYSSARDIREGERPSPQSVDEFKKYVEYMPPNLRHDNFDILLLYSEEDRQEAKEFQTRIQRECVVTVSGISHHPVVNLEDECIVPDNPALSLDSAFQKALYIFLFVTQAFCEQNMTLYKGHACLNKAINEKKWSVIPVHTEDRQTRGKKKYGLPMMLDTLHKINYWDRDINFCKENILNLLKSNVSCYEDMNIKLDDERKEHFQKHEDELKRQYSNRLSRSPPEFHHKTPMQEHGGKSNEGELKVKHTSPAYSDLKCNPDDLNNHHDVAYGSHQGSTHSETSLDSCLSTHSETRSKCLDPGLSRDAANLESQSSHVEEGPFNLKKIAPVLPNLRSNHDQEVSTTVNAPSLSSNIGRETLAKKSAQHFTSAPSTSGQMAFSNYVGPSGASREPPHSPGPSTQENSQQVSEDTGKGARSVVHHHHHHHHHKHVNIENAKYVAVGENPKVHAVDGADFSKDSDDESGHGENIDEDEAEEEGDLGSGSSEYHSAEDN